MVSSVSQSYALGVFEGAFVHASVAAGQCGKFVQQLQFGAAVRRSFGAVPVPAFGPEDQPQPGAELAEKEIALRRTDENE